MQSTDYDGTSFVWNIMPSSKSLTLKTLIPQAVHYTFKSPSSILVNATVLRCSRCQAVFNPYCRYEENLRQVYCCFCGHYTNVKEKFKELPESFLP